MSAWFNEDGEDLRSEAKGSYDVGGGDFTPIPDNTTALACIEQIGWVSNTEDVAGRKITIADTRHVQATWNILAPEELAGRKVTQNLWIEDDDPRADNEEKAKKKRTKAKMMLLAIDSNAGGKLAASNKELTDEALQSALSNKPMVIKIMAMMDRATGEFITNWVRAVDPKVPKGDIPPVTGKPIAPRSSSGGGGSSQSGSRSRVDDDDEIPF